MSTRSVVECIGGGQYQRRCARMLITMTNVILSDEDIEELKRFPVLWESYQRFQQQEARLAQARDDILETLVTRFDPPASAYRKIEKGIATIEDLERLSALVRCALLAVDFAAFAREISGETDAPRPED